MAKSGKPFAVDARVEHFQYGTGTITAIDADYTFIEFDKYGKKKFMTSMLTLEPTDTAAPVKPAPKTPRAAKPRK